MISIKQIAHEVALLKSASAVTANGLSVAVVPGSLRSYAILMRLVSRCLCRPTVEGEYS